MRSLTLYPAEFELHSLQHNYGSVSSRGGGGPPSRSKGEFDTTY